MKNFKIKLFAILVLSFLFIGCSYQSRVDKIVNKGTKLGYKVKVLVETDTAITLTQNFYD